MDVLHRSEAMVALWTLHAYVPRLRCFSDAPPDALRPGPTGGAFWRSVVEYEGPEVCLEVALWEAADALAQRHSAGLESHVA